MHQTPIQTPAKIYVNHSITGAGKTDHFIDKVSHEHNYIYAAPTNAVQNATTLKLQERGFHVENIHQHTTDSAIKSTLTAIRDKKHIIVCSHSTLQTIMNNHDRTLLDNFKHYHVVIDELINFSYMITTNAYYYESLGTFSTLDFVDTNNKELQRISVKDDANAKAFIKSRASAKQFTLNSKVQTNQTYIANSSFAPQTFYQTLQSIGYDLLVSNASLERLQSAVSAYTSITFMKVLSREFVSSCARFEILSARFDITVSRKILELNDIELVFDETLPITHTFDKLNICYVLDNYTATERDKTNIQQSLSDYVAHHHNRFIFKCNQESKFRSMFESAGGLYVISESGSNEYIEETVVVSSISQNPPPEETKKYKDFGITYDDIERDRNAHSFYQLVSRSKLRTHSVKTPCPTVYAYCISKKSADFLHSLFPLSPEPTRIMLKNYNSISSTTNKVPKMQRNDRKSLDRVNYLYKKSKRGKNLSFEESLEYNASREMLDRSTKPTLFDFDTQKFI
mgnify:CR=1 FL=1